MVPSPQGGEGQAGGQAQAICNVAIISVTPRGEKTIPSPSQPLAPQQIFDGSFFEAVLNTPQLKVAPPDVQLGEDDEEAATPLPDDIETFDWDAYNHAFFERIPDSAKHTEQGRQLTAIAGTQIWMVRRLPLEVVDYLLRVTPAKILWAYLNQDSHKELLYTATRGFQRTSQIVRQNVVRSRLLKWFEKTKGEIYILLVMWSFTEPQPPLIAVLQSESDSRELKERLPVLLRRYGVEGTLVGLCYAAHPRAFLAVFDLMKDRDEFLRLMQNDSEELAEDASREPAIETAPEADSEAATYWRNRSEAVEARLSVVSSNLNQLLDQSERSSTTISNQKKELELLHTRAQAADGQWARKLENTEKRLSGELGELRKNAERQNRKLRALEREKADFETENRRLKKQLRHTAQLLEEERRKMAGREAATEAPPAPVAAVSTPQTSQSAPNRPVVVQSPTPLDEIFEWRADGRPVKITPRAVRRLIDGNDEDAIYTLMQALESLKLRDVATFGKFLNRLGEGSAFYARVLTQRMTRILVDASNVARHTPNRYGKGQLRHLLEMRDELRRLDCFPILFYADASLRYFIDEPQRFQDMVAHGEMMVADKGIEADEILAREARRTGAYVVTNDAKFFHKVSPDFEPPRVSFRIYDGTVIVDDF